MNSCLFTTDMQITQSFSAGPLLSLIKLYFTDVFLHIYISYKCGFLL